MARFVVCVPIEGGTASVAPCGDADGVYYQPSVLVAPGPGEFDPAALNDLFSYGLSVVVFFWALGVCCGAIFSVIRKGG